MKKKGKKINNKIMSEKFDKEHQKCNGGLMYDSFFAICAKYIYCIKCGFVARV